MTRLHDSRPTRSRRCRPAPAERTPKGPLAALLALTALLWPGLTGTGRAAPVEAQPTGVKQVVVVFKTHFDIGYTDMASNVVRRYRTTMIDEALKVVAQSRALPPEQQFAWTLPGWPLSKIMEDWPGQTSERKSQVKQAFAEGRFVAHALPFTTHTELLEPEDLVRGLGYASRLSREAGLSLPRDAKMTDVPCHSWILPTLLRHAGVDFLHLGCNAASRSPQTPRLFWWEGPDGSRLLTMYTAESYGTGLVPPRDWPYQTWLALIHTGDNHGPPTPDEVKKLLAEAANKLPGVRVRIGRLSDFADGILAEKADVPVVRGDMPDSWIHGPMCDPQGAKLARTTRPALGAAESLQTLLGAWGVKTPEAAPLIAKACEQSLLYGEHTWGGALYWVTRYGAGAKWGYGDTWRKDHSAGRFQRLEGSWAEHTAYIEAARDLVQPLARRQMQALADSVRGGSLRPRVVVFNPLPWKRSGSVALDGLQPGIHALEPADGGEPVAVEQRMEGSGIALRFFARDVPAGGYRAYLAAPRTPAAPAALNLTNPVIESAFFKAELDPRRGTVRSLLDKRRGVELVDSAARHGFGQFLFERFNSNNVAAYVKDYVKISADWALNELGKPNLPPTASKASDELIHTNWAYALRQDRNKSWAMLSGGKRVDPALSPLPLVETRVIHYHDQPCVDLEMDIRGKLPDPWPEAGWLCLPFKIDSPRFRVGRLGSIVDPAIDIVPGANRHLLGLNTGLALFDAAGAGVGVCPLDNPLISLEAPGCWKYSMDFVPRKPAVYVNLFNNQWTTNFRLWNAGSWTVRLRLWTFGHYNAESALVTPALEARYPLMAAVSDRAGGVLPAVGEGLQLSRKGVLVSAFGPNPDGAGTVLRLWELAGTSGACQVRLPSGLAVGRVQPADLRGRPVGDPVEVKDGAFQTTLRAFAPASFIIRN